MLIDTHAHLPEDESKIKEIIEEAKDNGVGNIIVAGTNPSDNEYLLSITQKYKEIFLAIGYHPEYANEITDDDIKKLEEQIKTNEIVAIGEIGLDYYYEHDKNAQIELLKKQLELAEKYQLPVVIHSRNATEDTINILKKYSLKGTIHCFSGSIETAKQYLKMGFKIGVGGVLTFKNSNLKDVVKQLDIKDILLETDSPYLSPYRGEENSPRNIKVIAEFLSQLKECELEEITKITTENAIEIFDLKI